MENILEQVGDVIMIVANLGWFLLGWEFGKRHTITVNSPTTTITANHISLKGKDVSPLHPDTTTN